MDTKEEPEYIGSYEDMSSVPSLYGDLSSHADNSYYSKNEFFRSIRSCSIVFTMFATWLERGELRRESELQLLRIKIFRREIIIVTIVVSVSGILMRSIQSSSRRHFGSFSTL